ASFTYRVKDATGTVSAASTTVKLTVLAAAVNKAPTAVADGPFKTVEDTALTITAAQLVGNDTDPNSGDKLRVASVGSAVNGTATLNPDGSVRFVPTANFNGTATFTYKVKDTAGAVSANSATVTVTVSAVNDAPVGVPDTFTIPNAPRTFTVAELVGNDTDPDKVYGDTLRINSVGGPSNGSVKLNPDGT
ncbi:cadherin-like domain-containing protein, partial [Mycolicibacterium sp. F2034L]|uniref:cadherin-like domain-containing protein n=1 Tax=Mycolicibacterium sp. F2034L TaxID=2926422 RepID=UPI001FF4057A